MKNIVISILLFCVSISLAHAQNTMSAPVDLGTKSQSFSYTNTLNTASYTNNYIGKTTNDVYYKFTLSSPMDIVINHCGSVVSDTYLWILSSSGSLLYSNDDYSGVGACNSTYNSYIKIANLAIGTYYVVSEGYSQNGNITTNIQGVGLLVGNSFDNPIVAGSFSTTFNYTDTKNTTSYSNAYNGRPTNDVYYKFTLSIPMDITINHCGSAVSDTYLWGLTSSGTLIGYNDNYSGVEACSNTYHSYIKITNLAAGTYYVVSEGYSQNGNITTNVSGVSTYGGLSANENKNYTLTVTPLVESSDATFLTTSQSLQTISYFDGLGRPTQTIQRGITPDGKDLVAIQEYDTFGRESNTWLPGKVPSTTATITNNGANNGAFVPIETAKGYIKTSNGSDAAPYSRPVYEASPLNRVLEQYGPGSDWQTPTNGKSVRTGYLTNKDKTGVINTVGDSLICALYVSSSNPQNVSISKSINYAANQLYVTRMIDEDGNRSYEFKDKLGQVVLTRQINNNQLHDTYYIYDDFGNLRVVLPPIASDKLSASGTWTDTNTDLLQYAYLYKYDNRNRPISKKLPGCEPILYVYDKADRLIFTQDGEQRGKTPQEWTYAIPDPFGRVVLTGTCQKMKIGTATTETAISPGSLDNVVVRADWAKTTNPYKGYTIAGITLTVPAVPTLLSVNYYDSYEFMEFNGMPKITDANFKPETITGYGVQYAISSKGMLTGSMAALLDGSTTMLYSVMYYDNRGRLIQTKSNNHLAAGIEKEYIAYNFTGQPTKRMHIHSATGKTTQTEVYTYAYDHAGRLLTTKHKLNTGAEVILAENTYDELGRLKTNKKASNANLQTTYAYNIRSWTKSITNTNFIENLDYTYNGNIKWMDWTQASQKRRYDYTYDNLSQLTKAAFTGIGTEKYATSYTYDKHGNMLNLLREGKNALTTYGTVDNVTITYTGNQLLKATDAIGVINIAESADFKDFTNQAVEYTFNKNGSMTKDLNKGITKIEYNSLNLPRLMDIKSPLAEARKEYTYTASGAKLRVVSKWNPSFSTNPVIGSDVVPTALTKTKTTDYVGNIVYEDNALKRILVDGGYIEGGLYNFYLTDHLGNNRAVAKADASIIQRTQFYPFGAAFADGLSAGLQPYKYNGKELDAEHGVNWYDYSARQKSDFGFTSVDPLAEKYYSWSPYVYCLNNPLKYIDPKGDSVRVYTETVDGGHAWMSTHEGNNMTVYSFGPFTSVGGTVSSGHTVLGHGIVVKYTGTDAIAYINKKESTTDMVSNVITDISDNQMTQTIENVLNGGVGTRETKTELVERSARTNEVISSEVIGTTKTIDITSNYGGYNVATNNCTTFVSDMLNKAGSNVLNTTRTVTDRKHGETYPITSKAQPILPSSLRRIIGSK